MATIQDASFEQTPVASGQYTTDFSASGWQSGNDGSGIALLANSSDTFQGGYSPNYFNAAPDGVNVCGLLGYGAISQSIPGWVAGRYSLTFRASQRRADNNGSNNQAIRIEIDGAIVDTIQPANVEPFGSYTTQSFTVTAGTHVLRLVGAADGVTAMVDALVLTLVQAAPTPIVPGSVAVSAVTGTGATLTLSGTSGGTTPYSLQFQQAPDAGGSPGAWANLGTAGAATTCTATGLPPATKLWFRAIVADSGATPQTATTAAVSVTTGPLVLPSAPTVAASHSGDMDTITYQAATAGTYPIASYCLFNGTTAGGESATRLATNPAAAPMAFSNNSGGYFYQVRAVDSVGNLSAASNEVQGGATPTGGVTLTQMQMLLGNLATVLMANISTELATFFAARDAMPVAQSAQDLVVSIVDARLIASFTARDATPAPQSAINLVASIVDTRIAAAFAARDAMPVSQAAQDLVSSIVDARLTAYGAEVPPVGSVAGSRDAILAKTDKLAFDSANNLTNVAGSGSDDDNGGSNNLKISGSTVGAVPAPTLDTFACPVGTLNPTSGAYGPNHTVFYQPGGLSENVKFEKRRVQSYIVIGETAYFKLVALPMLSTIPGFGHKFSIV